MKLKRALSATVFAAAVVAPLLSASCSKNGDDGSLGDPAGTSGTGGTTAGTAGSSMVEVTGGSGGSSAASGGGGSSAQGGSSGDMASGAGAGNETGVASCDFSGTALAGCGQASVEADLRVVNMLVVLDKSGSMVDQPDGFDQSKWESMKTALATSLGRVKTEMNFGLLLYPYELFATIPLDGCTTDCCSVPEGGSAVVVSVQPGTAAAEEITRQLKLTSPGGGTPTAKALAAAREYFTTGEGSKLPGNDYVLLATDGGPNCNTDLTCDAETCTQNLDGYDCNGNCCKYDNARDQCLDDASVVAEIEGLYAEGIPTFVVGLPGTAQYSSYLDTFADAGGEPASGGSTHYYAVSPDKGAQGLVDVFDTITTQLVRSCDIPLQMPPPNKDLVNVAVDCVPVPKDGADGSTWEFDDPSSPTAVTLVGPVCDRLQRDGAQRIDVIFGCRSVR